MRRDRRCRRGELDGCSFRGGRRRRDTPGSMGCRPDVGRRLVLGIVRIQVLRWRISDYVVVVVVVAVLC